MEPGHRYTTDSCRPVNEVLDRVGDKWTVLVVTLLGQGTMRFTELKRKAEGVSQKMLTVTLRGLERDGFVTRTVYPTIPPKVEYALTDLGRELLIPVRALADFAFAAYPRIQSARKAYDAEIAGAA